MTLSVTTRAKPEPRELIGWLQHTRSQKGMRAAREALTSLLRRYPDHSAIAELADWHDESWWQPLAFGGISLERQTPEHFEFVWTLALDREFSSRFDQLPESMTPKDLLEKLTADEQRLIPEAKSIHWIVFQEGAPIGLAMLVNINFRHRIAELAMGILPSHGRTLAVADACCASLMFAFNCLGMNKVQGRIPTSDPRVAQLLKRVGFLEEGCFTQEVWLPSEGRYQDRVQLSMLRDEFALNRIIQRHARRRHDTRLDHHRAWPREPLQQFRV